MRSIGEYSSPKKLWNECPPSGGSRWIGRPKKVGRGMPDRPSGPRVNSYQLSRMMRTISPKPSVTMAR
ncbi:hypothetical protein D3C83_22090 [compost metagenome]